MQEFIEIARTDFTATFGGAWIFPVLSASIIWILWKEREPVRKILIGLLPVIFLVLYWCPLTGILFMKVLVPRVGCSACTGREKSTFGGMV